MPAEDDFTSVNSTGSQGEDCQWDHSMSDYDIQCDTDTSWKQMMTPRNSVVFPVDELSKTVWGEGIWFRGKRSLSELLRLHTEKGTDVKFSEEDACRLAEVLGKWVSCLLTNP